MTDAELFEAFRTYQQGRAFSPRTVKRRLTALRSLARHVAPLPMAAVTPEDLDEWLARLGSPKTRHAYRSDVLGFYTWAVRRRLLEHNPVLLTDSIRVPKALPRPIPSEVLDEALRTGSGRTQLALLLGALAGLRAAEIAALDAADVHLDAEPQILVVRNGKGGKDRIVPLHPMLAERLEGRRGLLFPAVRRGGHVSGSTMSALLCRTLTRAGGGRLRYTCHQLRHFFGTEAARASRGNVLVVSSMMGHASPTTTMGYVAWSSTEGAAVVAQIMAGGDELARRRAGRAAS